MPRPGQDALEWKETLFDLVPQWTRDPSIAVIESVCRQQLHISPKGSCSVTFHASGLFNKLYLVKCTGGPLIMRVSLPVYPRHKTRAEIGYEWILVEFMAGTPAHRRWRTMPMDQKAALTKRIAAFQMELAGIGLAGKAASGFRGIGTLVLRDAGQNNNMEETAMAVPGLGVSPAFFVGDRLRYAVPRGPFRSSHDWLSAELTIVILHQTALLEKAEDEDDKEDVEEIISAARKLLSLLPKIFPPTLDRPEITGLYHHDLHLNNILVDEQGGITAVLDWECVSALPLWMLTQVPKFIDGPLREEEPQRDSYADETPEEAAAAAEERNNPDYLDNEGKNELYFIHKMEYEVTQLRKTYEARLRELWPERPLEESSVKNDFFQAVSQCDGIWVKETRRWADCLERGETVRFEDA
ncbi:phosphotransferase enzyme family-domain-containing protein [Chaetomium fimeti]|uniref:Phosphotransferase enzyme family-domain-containing protein n=1 Tax=Chaetomium fimeti TaxID=1854472 RepID=A0AAE0HAL7_9PEZI|nr:phosphotransferase enzyme family-domain-containing protein [Chaetomium fimeti]